MNLFLNISDFININLLTYLFLFITIFINLIIIYHSKNFNLFIFFQASLIFFIFYTIFYDLILNNELLSSTRMGAFDLGELNENSKYELITLLIISQISFYLGYQSINFIKESNFEKIKKDNNFYFYGLFIFIIFTPIYFYKSYLKYVSVKNSGYLSIHLGVETLIEYPFWTFGAGIIFDIAFCFILASRPNLKIVSIIFVIFMSMKFFDSMRGQRVLIAIPIVFFIWYILKNYVEKLNYKVVLLCFTGFYISILIFINIRNFSSNDYNNISITYPSQISNFVYNQSYSVYVLAYMIENKKTFVNKDYKYILHKFYMIINDWKGQSEKMIDEFNSLSDELAYYIDKSLYLSGGGIGSSFYGEFYDLGYLGFILCCLILGFIINLFEKYYIYSRLIQTLSYYFVGQTIWMARAETFYFIKNIIFLLIIYTLAKIFMYLTKNSILNFNKY